MADCQLNCCQHQPIIPSVKDIEWNTSIQNVSDTAEDGAQKLRARSSKFSSTRAPAIVYSSGIAKPELRRL